MSHRPPRLSSPARRPMGRADSMESIDLGDPPSYFDAIRTSPPSQVVVVRSPGNEAYDYDDINQRVPSTPPPPYDSVVIDLTVSEVTDEEAAGSDPLTINNYFDPRPLHISLYTQDRSSNTRGRSATTNQLESLQFSTASGISRDNLDRDVKCWLALSFAISLVVVIIFITVVVVFAIKPYHHYTDFMQPQ